MSDTNLPLSGAGTFPATAFSLEMTQLTGNAGGNLQSLPPVTKIGARLRVQVANIVMAGQAAGTRFHVARLPIGALLLRGTILSQIGSIASLTLSLGNSKSLSYYGSLGSIGTALATAISIGQPGGLIAYGYDQTGAVSTDHDDVLLTTGGAALPNNASAVLRAILEYAID